MRRNMTISLLGILGIALVALVLTFASGNSPKLGLDLQGGASVVLTPKTATSSGTLGQAEQIINNRINGSGVSGATVERQGGNIVVELPGVKDATTAIKLVGETAQLQFRPVELDSSGQELIYPGAGPPSAAAAPSGTSGASGATGTSGASGVSGATGPSGTSGASGATGTSGATGPASTVGVSPTTTKGALGATSPRAGVATAAAAQAVAAAAPGAQTVGSTAPPPAAASGASGTSGGTGAAATIPTSIPATTATTAAPAASSGPAMTSSTSLASADAINQVVVLPSCTPANACSGTNRNITARYVLGPVLCNNASQSACKPTDERLTGKIVSSASAQVDTTGNWTVNVTFTGHGGSEWDNVVGKQFYQKYVAVVLDNAVISAPQINAQQFNGSATISGGGTGGFTHSEASQLALVFRYGALPVQFNQSEVQTISASLGKASLHAGLVAGFIGLALVLLYMIFYYRALGLVVVMGLGLSGALLYCLYTYMGNSSSFNASLSLASVVGIIVSVGVTADSYIVYFERLKDEIRAGRSVRSSVDKSFGRAWRTIWTADLVSIIAAVLLWFLTIGDVRGFAFSLGLATTLDLITAYTFTRPMVFLLGRNRTIAEARFVGVARGLAAAPAGGAS